MNKPKMYHEINKKFNNNREVFMSYNNDSKVIDTNDIRKKIKEIFKRDDFIYRTKVNIVIDNQIITKKIIGLFNNNLVTIDNEQIPIELIKDIYKD